MAVTHLVSWSEIDTYRQCPHKHDLSYIQRWKEAETSPALTRGTAWHGVMEAHYNVNSLLDLSISIEDAFDLIKDEDTADLIRWMYEGYTELYGNDPEWEIIAVEFPFQVWLPTLSGGRSNFKLKGKIDLVIRWKGKLYIVDHKSCKDLPNGKKLELDDQFGLYTWAMKQLGKPIFASMHSAARTQRNKEKPQTLESRFRRTPLYRGDAELDRIAKDAYLTMRNAYRGEEGERNTNVDTCGWRCSFTESCLHGRKTTVEQELDYMRNAGYVQDFTRH